MHLMTLCNAKGFSAQRFFDAKALANRSIIGLLFTNGEQSIIQKNVLIRVKVRFPFSSGQTSNLKKNNVFGSSAHIVSVL